MGLDKYNSECMVAHRQRLVWKLSNRTLRHLRPTDKLRATLPTICEAAGCSKRARSTSECSLQSEEGDTMSLSSEEDDDLNRSSSSSAADYDDDKMEVEENNNTSTGVGGTSGGVGGNS